MPGKNKKQKTGGDSSAAAAAPAAAAPAAAAPAAAAPAAAAPRNGTKKRMEWLVYKSRRLKENEDALCKIRELLQTVRGKLGCEVVTEAVFVFEDGCAQISLSDEQTKIIIPTGKFQFNQSQIDSILGQICQWNATLRGEEGAKTVNKRIQKKLYSQYKDSGHMADLDALAILAVISVLKDNLPVDLTGKITSGALSGQHVRHAASIFGEPTPPVAPPAAGPAAGPPAGLVPPGSPPANQIIR